MAVILHASCSHSMASKNIALLSLYGALAFCTPLRAHAQADDAASLSSMTPEQWRAHVLEIKRRVHAENIRRRGLPPQRSHPTSEELAQIATERVLTDSSLRFGDVVVTNRGKFEFRGTAPGDPRPEDFVRLTEP